MDECPGGCTSVDLRLGGELRVGVSLWGAHNTSATFTATLESSEGSEEIRGFLAFPGRIRTLHHFQQCWL